MLWENEKEKEGTRKEKVRAAEKEKKWEDGKEWEKLPRRECFGLQSNINNLLPGCGEIPQPGLCIVGRGYIPAGHGIWSSIMIWRALDGTARRGCIRALHELYLFFPANTAGEGSVKLIFCIDLWNTHIGAVCLMMNIRGKVYRISLVKIGVSCYN